MKRKNVLSFKLLSAVAILSITALSCDNNDTNDSSTVTTNDTTVSTVVPPDTATTTNPDTTKVAVNTVPVNKPGSAKPNPAKKGKKGKITITAMPPAVKTAEAKMEPDASGVYVNTETTAAFPGGTSGLQKYFNSTLEYPAEATNEGVEGTVTLSFVVDEKGKVNSPQVVGSNLGYGLDEEAIRVLKNMPKWTPAKVKGNNVKTRLTLPVRFVLE